MFTVFGCPSLIYRNNNVRYQIYIVVNINKLMSIYCQYVALLPGCGLILSVRYPFTRVWSYAVSTLPFYQGVVLCCQYVTHLPGCGLILSVRYPFTRVWSYTVSMLPFYQGVVLCCQYVTLLPGCDLGHTKDI